MKKITLKFALVLLTSTTLFFACKKEEAAPAVDCNNISTSIVNDVTAYQTAVTTYSTAPTVANCNAVKSSLTNILNKIKDCPQLAAMKGQYEAVLADFDCTEDR